MVQFVKAMRDEKGEMVRNAHLLGFFRRICKLLFLRTKPVFVFDGGTPALKRRTVIARRRQRENAQYDLLLFVVNQPTVKLWSLFFPIIHRWVPIEGKPLLHIRFEVEKILDGWELSTICLFTFRVFL